MSCIRPVTASPAPNDKYPVNTSHRSDLCKNVALAVLFGSNGNSYTVCTQIYVYINILFTIQRCWIGQNKYKRGGGRSENHAPYWARVPLLCQPWPRARIFVYVRHCILRPTPYLSSSLWEAFTRTVPLLATKQQNKIHLVYFRDAELAGAWGPRRLNFVRRR